MLIEVTWIFAKFLFLPLFCGLITMRLLWRDSRCPLIIQLALSFPLGLSIVTFWIFVLMMLHVDYSYFTVFIPLLLMFAILGAIHFQQIWSNRNALYHERTTLNLKTFDLLMLLTIALYLVYIFWRALNIPVYGYDAIKVVAFKAKTFYFDRLVTFKGLARFQQYPPLVFLSHVWVALNIGYWNDQFIKIVSPVFYISFMSIQFYFVRILTNTRWALISIVLLLCSPFVNFHATLAYMDLPLMVYVCTTVFLLILWHLFPGKMSILLPGLFAAGACFSKREGTAFFVVFLVMLLVLQKIGNQKTKKEKGAELFKFILPSVITLGLFHWYLIRYGVPSFPQSISAHVNLFERAQFVLTNFFHEMFLSGNWNITWAFLLISLWNYRHSTHKNAVRLLLLALLLSLTMYLAVFCLTPIYYDWTNSSEPLLPRMLLHFFPLVCTLIALLNFGTWIKIDPE